MGKKEIREKYAGMAVGEYLTYNSVGLMAERLTPIDLLNLADWIDEKPYYIELNMYVINAVEIKISGTVNFLLK